MSDGRTDVALTRPIEHGGREIDGLSLRDPVVGDLVDADAAPTDMGRNAALVAACSGLPAAAVRKLHPADFSRALAEVGTSFLGGAWTVNDSGGDSSD